MTALSRRALLGAGAGLAAASVGGAAEARIMPRDMVPLIGPGYRAVDQDEKGLWQLMERVEEEVSGSNLLIKDPQLVTYLGTLIGNVGGPAARDMRIYLARIPEFNAVMFPTGFTVIFSGLLLLVFFPSITGMAGNFQWITGEPHPPFLGRWLLVTAVLFAVSAVVLAVRIRLAGGAPLGWFARVRAEMTSAGERPNSAKRHP